MTWSNYYLDKFAPKLSLVSECNASIVPSLPNYEGSLRINNSIIMTIYSEAQMVLIAHFIIRLRFSIENYVLARDNLKEYIGSLPDPQLSSYTRSIVYFETCVLQAHVSMQCLAKFEKITYGHSSVDITGDESVNGRLRLMSNRIKHFDQDIKASRGEGGTSLAPIWISNDGLESAKADVGFRELADLLIDCSETAKQLAENSFADIVKK